MMAWVMRDSWIRVHTLWVREPHKHTIFLSINIYLEQESHLLHRIFVPCSVCVCVCPLWHILYSTFILNTSISIWQTKTYCYHNKSILFFRWFKYVKTYRSVSEKMEKLICDSCMKIGKERERTSDITCLKLIFSHIAK